ncbi:MAG TPA: hypothetical protein VFN44_20545 [Solirubrobacteraceae bacterium]|nr:hypothetical protein [Solirubrobacteraceae bacterium]
MSLTIRGRIAAAAAMLLLPTVLPATASAIPGVTGPSPVGTVDHVSGGLGGFVQLVGWTFDPDAPADPGEVQVHIDGPAGSSARSVTLTADVHRPDVADVFTGVSAAHGFSAAIPGVPPGPHAVYVYAINRSGAGTDTLIRTATVDVPATPAGSPFGFFDEAISAPLGARLRGWTVDPDALLTPTAVHVYVDGPAGTGARGIDLGPAAASRPDVGAAVPGAGAEHGLDRDLADLPPGVHTLWTYAINAAGPGANPLLGARSVRTGDAVAEQPSEGSSPDQASAQAPPLKTMGATVSYSFFPRHPRRSTRFSGFRVGNVPRGSTVVGRCLTAAGKACKGRLKPGFLKTGAGGSLRVRAFDRRYPAGTRLEVVISNPAYRSQIKTVLVRANKRPRLGTRCQAPGTTTRSSC